MGKQTATKNAMKVGPQRRRSLTIGPKKSVSQRLQEEAERARAAEAEAEAEAEAKAEAEAAQENSQPPNVNVVHNVAKAARIFKKRRRSSGQIEDRTLYVKYHVFNILDIDTLDSTFTARFTMEATWEEPQLNGFEKHEVTLEMLDNIWKPRKVKFTNEIEGYYTNASEILDGNEDAAPQIEVCDWEIDLSRKNKNAVMTCYFHYFGTFSTKMSLGMFPFDYQTLTISMEMHARDANIVFVDNPFRSSKVDVANVKLSEWYVLGHCGKCEKHASGKMNVFVVHIGVRRRAGYYVQSVFFPIFIISSLTGLAYTISAEPDDRGMRIQVILLLFLTSIAFKFYVADNLPKIAYSTLCDGYVLCALVFQATIAIEVGMVGAALGDHDLKRQVDIEYWFLGILFILWTLFHIAIIVMVIRYKGKVRIYTKQTLKRQYVKASKVMPV